MTDASALTRPAASVPAVRSTFARAVHAEWIKLHTVRSTIWLYAVLVTVSAGLGVLFALTTLDDPRSDEQQAAIVVSATTFWVFLGQMIVAVLGVLAITGEYASGQIRSTLTSVHGRLTMLGAKAVVVAAASFSIGILSSLVAYLASAPILASRGVQASLLEPSVALPLLGTAFYLVIVSLFGLGLGQVIRSTAGAVTAVLGLVLILPFIVALTPFDSVQAVQPYLLLSAGSAIGNGGNELGGWLHIPVALAWPVAALAAGALLLDRRDA